MWEDQLALFESGFDRRLFRRVERAIVICVILRELGIHLPDMGDHHFDARLDSIRWRVRRDLERASDDGFGKRFPFRRVELAILVRVERCDLWEEFGEMFDNGGGIVVMLHRAVTLSATVMDLGDCEPATNGEAEHTDYCECFDIFHTFCVSLLVISLPWQRRVAGSGCQQIRPTQGNPLLA
jgi:hypothetical protein